jgi:hypothetical protein
MPVPHMSGKRFERDRDILIPLRMAERKPACPMPLAGSRVEASMKTHFLKLTLAAALIFPAAIATAADNPPPTGASPSPAAVQKYTCPMHPEVLQDKPGKCPKCGMKLEPKKGEATPKQ